MRRCDQNLSGRTKGSQAPEKGVQPEKLAIAPLSLWGLCEPMEDHLRGGVSRAGKQLGLVSQWVRPSPPLMRWGRPEKGARWGSIVNFAQAGQTVASVGVRPLETSGLAQKRQGLTEGAGWVYLRGGKTPCGWGITQKDGDEAGLGPI